MAEENNIGASRLLGTNGFQQAVDSLTNKVNQMGNDIGKLVSSLTAMTGAFNRSTGASTSGAWNNNSNRSQYGSNGGGGVFGALGRKLGNGGGGFYGGNNGPANIRNGGGGFFSGGRMAASGNGGSGGGRFGNFGAGSRLSFGVSAALGVASAITDYGNKNMDSMMQENFAANQSAMYGGNYNNANVHLAQQMQLQNVYGSLGYQDMVNASYTNQYTFGNSMFNGQQNTAYTMGAQQVGGLAYMNPTLGLNAAAQAASQMYTPRASMMAQMYGLGPTIGAGGTRTSLDTIAQQIFRQNYGNAKLTAKGVNASMMQNGGLNYRISMLGNSMGWSQQTQQSMMQLVGGQALAQSQGMNASKYYNLINMASNPGSTGDAARAQLKKLGIGNTAFEAQRNLNATGTIRQSDVNESMADAFIKTTNVVNQFSQALTALMKSTGLDKVLGTSAGILSPVSNALSGFSGAFGAGMGVLGAARMMGGFGGGGGGIGGMLGNIFKGGGGGGAGGASTGAAGGAAADAAGPMAATQAADGSYLITTLGAGGAEAGGAAAAGAGGLGAAGAVSSTGVGAAVVGAAAIGTLGWKNAVGKEAANEPGWMKAASAVAQSNPYTGMGFAEAGMARRAWDKFITGKNKESFWSLFNPFGQENRGPSGGGSSSVVGNSKGNGSSNIGANAAQIIRYAETQLNVPYLWGGETPGKGMDCSGLTQWAYGQAGVKIPRVAADQQSQAPQSVPTNQTQPGDLLFVGKPAHHVVMAIGGGKIIEAPHTGANVRIRALNPSEFTSAGRYVNAVGNMSSLLNGNTAQGTNTMGSQAGNTGGDIGGGYGTSELAAIMSGMSMGAGGNVVQSQANGSSNSTGATSGATGGNPVGNGQNDKSSLQNYAKQLLAKYGWAGQWADFNALEMSEAGWDVHATNPSSGAYGLAQALPASKYGSAGSDWKSNGDTQLNWMMDYIKGRYGSPSAAWSFHKKNNWYAAGAYKVDKDQTATVHAGEMIIPAKQAESIRQVLMNNQFNPGLGNSRSSGVGRGDIYLNVNIQLPGSFTGTYQDTQDIGKAVAKATAEQLRISNLQTGQ